ncbi:hypothetical protein [Psychrobacillus sp. L3]|uniref:hypothetical protein n=1 Tax=Psychrobacillus sp. L3 TaxID=3236891 RepID=UPI0036F33F2C
MNKKLVYYGDIVIVRYLDYCLGGMMMNNVTEKIKVEFEIKGFGEETTQDYDGSYKGIEVVRTKDLPKDTTLEEIETIVNHLFEEIELIYGKQPEHLLAKVVIRATKKDTQITYLG